MVASLVEPCKCLADVGCDHGYLSIWLLREGICERAICMDLRPGPLSKAKENLSFFHMDERGETRLSDGVKELAPGEADAVVIAGMGGELMCKILSDKPEAFSDVKQLILQPQSDIPSVRKKLHDMKYHIVTEDRLVEDGKLYHVFRAVPGMEPVPYSEAEYISGARGITEAGKQVAVQYLEEQIAKKQSFLSAMEHSERLETLKRKQELTEELRLFMEAREAFS